MLSTIVQRDGSCFVIIPEPLLQQAGISESVIIRLESGRIVLERDTDLPGDTG